MHRAYRGLRLLANIVNQPTASSASAAGIRVIPGDPEHSVLFLAVSAETTDPSIKRAWITALPHGWRDRNTDSSDAGDLSRVTLPEKSVITL